MVAPAPPPQVPRPGRLLGADLEDVSFLPRLRSRVTRPGTVVGQQIRVPESTAQRLLHAIVHLVADIPADAPPDVVWQRGRDELLVHTETVALTCTRGLVTVGVKVECDQLEKKPAVVKVPLAVGDEKTPRGLVMSTFARPEGPTVVVDAWADPLVGFAWECLLELARKVCAAVGKDGQGRPLIPVEVGAEPKFLRLQPMARHDVDRRTLR